MAVRGGRTSYAFTRSPIAPIMMTPAYRWDEIDLRMRADTREFRPSHDLHYFRYVLVHSRIVDQLVVTSLALQPEAHMLEISGEWALLESTLLPPPAMSPEGSPPLLTDGNLRARVGEVAGSIREGQKPPM